MAEFRVGSGFDVHAFANNRELYLGGVKIEYPRGLAGHSDADVVLHSLCDALLGAAAMGDIGRHFPPGDPQYKNIASLTLLGRVNQMLAADGWKLVNADITILCEQPKIAPHASQMREAIAACLGVAASAVSIKATTTERLGFTGREEGIAAHAVVMIQR